MATNTLILSDLRVTATRILTAIIWLHVPLAAAAALIARNPWQPPAAAAFGAALVASVAVWKLRDGLTLRSIIAICLTAGPVLFVYAGRGHMSGLAGNGDWQIDYHMYFFCVFAMLTAYVDWRPIALAAALTAGHHLILDLVVPQNVFPDEGIDRVLLHALAVIAECSVLFWLTVAINRLFVRVEEANELVEFTARATAEALVHEQTLNDELRRQIQHVHAPA